MIKIIEIDETVAVNIDEPKFDKAFQCMIKNIGGELANISYNVGYMSNISDIVKMDFGRLCAFKITFNIYISHFKHSISKKFNFNSVEIEDINSYKEEVKDRINTIYNTLTSIVHELEERYESREEFNPFTLY